MNILIESGVSSSRVASLTSKPQAVKPKILNRKGCYCSHSSILCPVGAEPPPAAGLDSKAPWPGLAA